MTDRPFGLNVHNGVARVTLSRPKRLNALTFRIYQELAACFDDLGKRSDVRAIIINGEGRAFCSGGDVDDIIAELFSRDMAGLLEFTRTTGNLIRSICEVPKPVIAAVHGVAVGAGAVMTAACDFRIVSENARFGFIFPQVGLCGADMGAAFLLPRIVGRGRAAEILYFGELFGAQRALDIGYANRVVPDQVAALALAEEWAERLARGPAFAHSMTKRMLEDESTMTLGAALEAEAQAQAICMQHPDFRTAHDAYKNKVSPLFEGAEVCGARNED
ncbi:MAG: enoyl-CoA hydratase/carnithine racemase [Myxococcota bacterium]|jgi:enoyl-CoA hydratase/carnithine racemase